MKIIQNILKLLRDSGFTTRYGTAYQLNDFFTDVDFSQSKDQTAVYMHLITAMESYDGKDRAEVAVYFARLSDFDFDGESLLPAQEEMKGYGEELLRTIACGNYIKTIGRARWQFGYDDFAENVCWVCMRVTVEDMAAFCVPFGEGCEEKPAPPTFRVETLPCSEVSDTGFTINVNIVNTEGKNVTMRGVQYFVKGIGKSDLAIFGVVLFRSSNDDYYQVRSKSVFTGETYSVRGIVVADGVEYQGEWVEVKTGEYIPQPYTVETLRYEVMENSIRLFGKNNHQYPTSFGFCYKTGDEEFFTQWTGEGSGSEFWLDIEKKAGGYSFYAYSFVNTQPRTLVRGEIIDFNI